MNIGSWDAVSWVVCAVFSGWFLASLARELLPWSMKRYIRVIDPFYLVPLWWMFIDTPAEFILVVRDARHTGTDEGWFEPLAPIRATLINFLWAPDTRREDVARRMGSAIHRRVQRGILTPHNCHRDLSYCGLVAFLAPIARHRGADAFQFAVDRVVRRDRGLHRGRVFVSHVHPTRETSDGV